MPPINVRIIQLALGYLAVGTTIGAGLLVDKGFGLGSALWSLRPLHVEMLLFGWLVQLAFGVGAWILPRTRGSERPRLLYAAIGLLNAGIWLAGLGAFSPPLLLAGRLAELVSALAFAGYIWPRVRSVMHRHDH